MVIGAVALVAAALTAAAGSGPAAAAAAATSSSHVLLVGTFDGHAGQYATIQAAVNAAKSGDWILVAPGDYHETADAATNARKASRWRLRRGADHHVGDPPPGDEPQHRHRGRHRPAPPRSRAARIPRSRTSASSAPNSQPYGRNGIVVWKANDVSIDNLTVCNFLGGAGDAGNEIWWNGGDGSGRIGLTGTGARI